MGIQLYYLFTIKTSAKFLLIYTCSPIIPSMSGQLDQGNEVVYGY